MEKATKIYNSNNKVDVSIGETEFIFVRDSGILKRLLVEEIYFMEAMGDYIKYLRNKNFTPYIRPWVSNLSCT